MLSAEIIAFGERHSPVIPNAPHGIVSVTKGGLTAKVAEPEYGSNVVVDTLAERRDRGAAASLRRAEKAYGKGGCEMNH